MQCAPGLAIMAPTSGQTRLFPSLDVRIRIYSDLHLEFAPFVPPPSDADATVLAGDIDNGAAGIEWASETFGKPVLYLAGNHEYYEGEFEAVQESMGAAARERAVELLGCSTRARSRPAMWAIAPTPGSFWISGK